MLKKTNYNTKISSLGSKIAKINSGIKELAEEFLLIFMGNILFDSEGSLQSYLIFQSVYRFFKMVTSTNYVLEWKSKGLSAESIKPPTTSDNNLTPQLSYYDYNIRLKFTGSCLNQSKITYTHKKSVIIYIVYELGASNSNFGDPTLKNGLFGAVTLSKNADVDKYRYSGYGIGFDRTESFSFPGGDLFKM